MVVVKIPRCQLAVAGDATFDFDDTSRPEVRPGEFFLPSPHHFHRSPRGARQTSGLERRVAGVLSSIRRARVRDDNAHTAFRNMKHIGKLVADSKRPLRPGPYREFPIGPLRHGRSRLERSMRDVRNGVSRVKPVRRAGEPFFDGSLLLAESILGFRRCVLLEIRKYLLARDLRPFFPLGMNRIESPLSLMRARRGYADKVSITHDEDAGHGLRSTVIAGSGRRTKPR